MRFISNLRVLTGIGSVYWITKILYIFLVGDIGLSD